MSQIPSDIAGSALQAGFAANRAAEIRDAERNHEIIPYRRNPKAIATNTLAQQAQDPRDQCQERDHAGAANERPLGACP